MKGRRDFGDHLALGRPYSPTPSNGLGFAPRSRFAVPFSRSRIHPLFLIPVFVLGIAYSRITTTTTLPEPVYYGDYRPNDEAYQAFLPPDAPPLNQYEEDDIRQQSARNPNPHLHSRPRSARGTGADDEDDGIDWEWDDDSAIDNDESSSRPKYFTTIDGYLYYPTSAPLVPMTIPKAKQRYSSSTPFDSLLVLPAKGSPPRNKGPDPATLPKGMAPPPPVNDWVSPQARFQPPPPANIPLHQDNNLSPQQQRGPLGGPAALPLNLPLARGPIVPQRPPTNAEEMRRAAAEGRPFKPVKPADLIKPGPAAGGAFVGGGAGGGGAAAAAMGAAPLAQQHNNAEQRAADVAARRQAAVDRARDQQRAKAKAFHDNAVPVFAPPGGAGQQQQRGPPPPQVKPKPGAAPVGRQAPGPVGVNRPAGAGVGAVVGAGAGVGGDERIAEARRRREQANERRKRIDEQRYQREQRERGAPAPAPAPVPGAAAPVGMEGRGRLGPKVVGEVAVPKQRLEFEDEAGAVAFEDEEVDDDRPPSAEELAADDEELLEVFESLTEEEKQLLTPAELDVFAELRKERDEARANGPLKFAPDVDDDLPAKRLRKRSFGDDGGEDLTGPSAEEVEKKREKRDAVQQEQAEPQAARAKLAKRDNVKPMPKDRLHPIAHLVQEAEEKWEYMLQRQSQTLFQAVMEYQRRYGRKPPLGFDAWWRYAMQNRVILVDEYDQIDEDIRPFFSLSASEIRQRAKQISTNFRFELHSDTFTVRVKDGAVTSSGPHSKSNRAEDTQDLIGEFAESLPDMSMTFTSHDLPVIAVSGEAKARHEHFAKNGHLLDYDQGNEILENTAYQPWQGLCKPNSTIRRVANGQSTGLPHLPSFVSTEHIRAMDICSHPETQYQNGFTAWEGPRPHLLYPLFSTTKTSMHSDILSASMDHFSPDVVVPMMWNKKTHNKVLWRGPTTGAYFARGNGWRTSQRSRLVLHTTDREGEREVLFADKEAGDAARRFKGPTADINEYYFDVGFTGLPTQCNAADDTCDLMVKEMRFLPNMNPAFAQTFKYILDIDSNSASKDFHRMLQSGSVIFKSTIFPEWWSKRIMPWYHYVPIKPDYSDLTDAAAFFIGAPNGEGAHDEVAQRIGENGKKWAKEHWREADMAAYQFRLYLEYARLISREEEGSHDFILDS